MAYETFRQESSTTSTAEVNRDSADLCRYLHTPSPVFLPQFTEQRRESDRPPALREPGFDAVHDNDTLVYDAFWDHDGRTIRLLCPPFNNLRRAMETMTVQAVPSGKRLRFRVRHLVRHAQILVDAPGDTTALQCKTSIGEFRADVGQNLASVFEGQRVIITHSKDNRLEWLQDWARYSRDVHGATAVLVYDNESTRYEPEDVLEALSALDGLDRIVVVSWPFRFGPQGDRFGRNWESFYFQAGLLENARRRFLSRARSVITSDVDELVVTENNESIFERVERSPFGVLSYHGIWIVSVDGQSHAAGALCRHRDFKYRLKPRPVRRFGLARIDANRCASKYAVVPARCPERALWDVHRIRGWLPALIPTSDVSFRHFRMINTNWKYDRGDEIYHADDVARDDAWIKACKQVRWDV